MYKIQDNPDVVGVINAILNNNGIAEVKREWDGNEQVITVVDIKRTLKTPRKHRRER